MKRAVSILAVIFLICALLLPCSAAEAAPPKVVDNAGLLTQSEIDALTEKAQLLADTYQMDAVILTVKSLEGKTPYDYADDYYDENGYGLGTDHSGVLFLLAMESRDWYISTCGEAIYAVTDYGISMIGDSVVNYLSNGDYYGGLNAFLNLLSYCYENYQAGTPVDAPKGSYDDSDVYYPGNEMVYYENHSPSSSFVLLSSAVIGLIAAALVIYFMRSSMNTRRRQNSAGEYLKSGTYRLRRHSDIFLYSRTSKVRRESSSSGSGGGSSTRRSSGGRCHGGGGGKF